MLICRDVWNAKDCGAHMDSLVHEGDLIFKDFLKS